MTRNADRVFYFDEGPELSKAYPKAQKSQTTWRLGHDQVAT
jgi:hypothetical protein